MKYFRLLILCLTAAALMLFGSCGKSERLKSPTGVYVEYETLTLKWNGSKDADTYSILIESEGKEPRSVAVSRDYYSLAELEAGMYKISITSSCASGELKDSYPSMQIEFEREKESGLHFKLINGGEEYEVSGKGDATGVIEIPSVYRRKPVSSIGERAFFNGSDVTRVIIPQSVTRIGDFAFASCSYLEAVELPPSLTYLGESAFSGCRALDGSITIPDTLGAIADGTFAYCASLDEVNFGKGIISIGDQAFTDCPSLSSLSLPKSLTKIGGFAFAACSGITRVDFNEGLLSLGEFAFSKAVALSSAALPDSLQYIGAGAFYHCTSLATVGVGGHIKEIDHSAFIDTPIYTEGTANEIYVGNWFIGLKDSTALSVEFKEGTVGIANNAFFANKYIQSIELPDTVQQIGKLAFANSDIVSVVIGSGVRSIGEQAFIGCGRLSTVFLGSFDYTDVSGNIKDSSLEYIGSYAFMNCTLLERIEIPETVKDIGAYAFRNTEIFNSSLTGAVYADNWLVDYNKNITEELAVYPGTAGISRYAFYSCPTLRKISIPGSVSIIGKGAFYGCSSLESVTLPDALLRIEDYTFYSCSRLAMIKLPPMLKEIGRSAFYKCGTAENYAADTASDVLVLPSGVTYIGDYAFFGCGYRRADAISGATETGGIDEIVIGSDVEYIGRCAFYGFASLKKITVESVLMIDDKAFSACPSLVEVTVRRSLTEIGDKAFYNCPSLVAVSFPDTLVKIGESAFYRCTMLKDADIGVGVREIGSYAFYENSSLEHIALCDALVSIGVQAFRGCDLLTSLLICGSVESIGANAFYSCDGLTLYVSDKSDAEGFDERWNSSFCPVVWGCEIAESGDYVVSICGGDELLSNNFADTVFSAPLREGYTFGGWALDKGSDEPEYFSTELAVIADGVRVYSVWIKE
ncbi:MAG: leucine-rich repeat domain-containing protein [Ruminococcaceae bacterium]|nr:leucine-rich repeat domain-containing protein [Oscillospiraceae bacterium]